jgi:hypothetical protein
MPAIKGFTRNHVGEKPTQNLCTSCTLDLVPLELHRVFLNIRIRHVLRRVLEVGKVVRNFLVGGLTIFAFKGFASVGHYIGHHLLNGNTES